MKTAAVSELSVGDCYVVERTEGSAAPTTYYIPPSEHMIVYSHIRSWEAVREYRERERLLDAERIRMERSVKTALFYAGAGCVAVILAAVILGWR